MIHGILTMLVSWARWLLKACHYAFKSQDNKPNRVGRGPFENHVDPIPEIGLKICSWLICNFSPQRWKLAYFSPSKSSRNLPIRFGDVFFWKAGDGSFLAEFPYLKRFLAKLKLGFSQAQTFGSKCPAKSTRHHVPFIHGAIQESLEIMLDNVTWQTLSTWVRDMSCQSC